MGSTSGTDEPVTALTRVLARTLRALGSAGRPVAASRLAAEGWSALRHAHPRDAERLTGVLHYLARLPEEADAEPVGTDRRGDEAT